MKQLSIKYKGIWNSFKIFFFSFVLIALATQCEIQDDFEYQYSNSTGELGVSAWEFIQNQDSLSLMEEAISTAGMESYYSGTTEYTFIVSRNSGWREYLEDNNYSSISEIPEDVIKSVIGYHIVKATILFSDPDLLESNNPIAYETISGATMYLSHDSSYRGLINEDTNTSWRILTSNLQPTNGVIHILADIVYLDE